MGLGIVLVLHMAGQNTHDTVLHLQLRGVLVALCALELKQMSDYGKGAILETTHPLHTKKVLCTLDTKFS